MAAVVETVGGEPHTEHFVLFGEARRVLGDQAGVGLALAAVERVGALATLELAGEDVTTGAIGGGQIWQSECQRTAPASPRHSARKFAKAH
jgi:hypothetical protein